MEKIPVGKSIGGAYGFLFGRILTILSLSWLPAAVYAVGRLMFLRAAGPGMLAAMHGEHLAPQAHLLHLAYFLFTLLMVSVIALPLNREALGMGGEPVAAHFVIGGREVRLFLAFIRFELLFIATIVVLAIAVMGAMWGLKTMHDTWAQNATLVQYHVQQIVHGLVVVSAILLLLFAALRLTFLIAPIAAAEDKARLSRAWSLSAGNFWRILAIFLAIIVPVIAAIACIEYALLGPQLHALGQAVFVDHQRPDPAVIADMMTTHAPLLVAIAAVGIVVTSALFAGASAVAYRTLVPPPEPSEPVEAEPETHARVEPQPLSGHEVISEPAHSEEPAHEAPHGEEAAHSEEAAHPEEPHHDAHDHEVHGETAEAHDDAHHAEDHAHNGSEHSEPEHHAQESGHAESPAETVEAEAIPHDAHATEAHPQHGH